MNTVVNFRTVPTTRFAPGCAADLAEHVLALGFSKPLIVTDPGIVRFNLMESALASLSQADLGCQVYSDVVADPPEENVIKAAAFATAHGCDGVVGFGGGSAMDVAKLVAVLMRAEQTLPQIYGVDKIIGSRLPLIQVPTTAGTGSEATSVAIVTTGEVTKAGVVSHVLFADTILLDPELTLGLPAHTTAATGIDAMVHAIEAFTSKRLKNPISDMLALKALSLMSAQIRTAVAHGDDLSARSDMLLGAFFAGQAFANAPVGAVHALAYPLGGVYHIPHGLSNSLVLPHVLRFNGEAAEPLYAQLLAAILPGARPDNASEQLAEYFLMLASELGLQTSLSEMNIPMTALDKLAEQAMLQTRLLINNPRTVSYSQALQIYREAF